ncbi:MAG: CapA family protein [Bifidobacterium sp.]|uniref:CapA family protein n=1 Tax=Bifidobacterium fermentum TaxID=3059035 RepID=A0AB39UDM5_9BIFI
MRNGSKPQHLKAEQRGSRSRRMIAMLMGLLLATIVVSIIWIVSFHILERDTGVIDMGSEGKHGAVSKSMEAPAPAVTHPGNAPGCSDQDCISVLVNGDLLFHPTLWQHFQGPDTTSSDGSAFDFTSLFSPMADYIRSSDIAVCEFETPIAKRGGPYAGYPVFAIPSEVVDAVSKVGYKACTHATNHSWDQGAEGIARLSNELAAHGIAQTGSYVRQSDSERPLVIDSPTGGGKLGLVTGTVSLNAMVPDYDWRVDRLRDFGDPQHQADIDRAVAKADEARRQGADIVALAMHSVQEYLDYADSWQKAEAHALAETGKFDVIYGAGCHCAQPIENYHGTWIIYGLGNAIAVSASADRIVNNQGVTARIQFAGKKGIPGSWGVSRIDWVATSNMKGGQYQWCPITQGNTCTDPSNDARIRQRISDVIYAMGADRNVVREWNLSGE